MISFRHLSLIPSRCRWRATAPCPCAYISALNALMQASIMCFFLIIRTQENRTSAPQSIQLSLPLEAIYSSHAHAKQRSKSAITGRDIKSEASMLSDRRSDAKNGTRGGVPLPSTNRHAGTARLLCRQTAIFTMSTDRICASNRLTAKPADLPLLHSWRTA